jgi:hypothetical protein
MTKFTGDGQKLVFNGITFGSGGSCLTSTSLNDTAAEYLAACAGATHVEKVYGLRNASVTVNGYLNLTDTALIAAIEPKSNAADFEWHPGGDTATYIEISATGATVGSLAIDDPVEGLCAYTFTLGLDDVTYGAAV